MSGESAWYFAFAGVTGPLSRGRGAGPGAERDGIETIMKFWKKLQNPFVLVGQGFVLGGLLFFATHGGSLEAAEPDQASHAVDWSASEAAPR